MIDLETLDTVPSAVILSIGMAVFDPESMEISRTFYRTAASPEAIDEQVKIHKRTIGGGTLHWWLAQDRDAQKVFTDRVPITRFVDLLVDARNFIRAHEAPRIWGNGADFDNVILADAFAGAGLPIPWSHTNNRCYRTITNLGIGPRRPATTKGVKHNALDDAINQAEHLMEVLACINKR